MMAHGQSWPSQSDFPDLSDVSVIARGAHATVYRAYQISAGREVALKVDNRVLPPESDDRRKFQQEARAVGALSEHQGIIDTYIAGFTSQGRPYMVTELCKGSYEDKIAENGPLQPDEVKRVGVRIADALAEAHEQRVLHRDIKPANLLIDYAGRPVLADFGVASLMDSRVGEPVVRAAMTPAYAPLETFHLRPSGEPGDVYSLSATLYALLSARPPRFPADDREFSIDDVLALFVDPIADIPGVSQTMLSMLRAAMTNNPEGRPSAMQFRDMLDSVPVAAATGTIPVVGAPPTPPAQPSQSPQPSPPPAPSPPGAAAPPGQASQATQDLPAVPPSQRQPEWSQPVPARFEPPDPERRPSPGPRHATWGVNSEPPAPPPSDNLPVPMPRGGSELATRRERRIASRGGKESSGMGSLILVGAIAVTIIVAGAIFAVWTFTGSEEGTQGDASQTAAKCEMEKFKLGCVEPAVCFNGDLLKADYAAATQISCKEDHLWEAYAKGKLTGGIDDPTYSVVAEQELVDDTCLNEGPKSPLTSIVGMNASKWDSNVLPPTEKEFGNGSRTFYCVVAPKDGKPTSGSAFG